MKRLALGTVVFGLLGSAVAAGPVTDFEDAYRAVYGQYRVALFATNSGNVEKSVGSLAGFSGGWAGLMQTYRDAPPPQYADDAQWGEAMGAVDALLVKAGEEVASGQLPKAHETLEGVREVLSALHMRNGVQTFSDRMNAYHAEMEHVLAIDPAGVTADILGELAARGAVMRYLADDLMAHPPKEAGGNAEYAALVADFDGSVVAFETAVKAGDLAAVKAAMAGLKKPYSMLFLKFG